MIQFEDLNLPMNPDPKHPRCRPETHPLLTKVVLGTGFMTSPLGRRLGQRETGKGRHGRIARRGDVCAVVVPAPLCIRSTALPLKVPLKGLVDDDVRGNFLSDGSQGSLREG